MVNPVEACRNHAERLGIAVENAEAAGRRARDAYEEVLSELHDTDEWLELQELLMEAIAEALGELYQNFLDSPVNEFLLTPRNFFDLIEAIEGGVALPASVIPALLSVLEASFAYDEWQRQEGNLRDAQRYAREAGADYRNCLCHASGH